MYIIGYTYSNATAEELVVIVVVGAVEAHTPHAGPGGRVQQPPVTRHPG